MSGNAGIAKRLEKFPAFDGFRGIGVVVVVFTHCPQVLDSSAYNAIWYVNQLSRVGYIALDIFFVISGFFITRLLLRERAKTGRISFKDFYMRRALRIFPVYYLTIFACYFIFRLGPAETLSLLTYTFSFYHPLHGAPNPLEHTWSLSVEEQFYFFWPMLILIVAPAWLNVVTGRVIPLLAVASGLLMALLFINHDSREAGDLVYMSLFTRMLSLSLGGWLAVREFENRPLRGWRCAALVGAAVVILVIDRRGRDLGIITSQPVYWTLALIAYSMVSVSFVATLVFDRGIIKRVMTAILSLSLFRGLGHLSYAMYVFHLPVLFYLGLNDAAIHGAKVPILQVALAFGITLGLSILSYYLLESPMAKLKQNFSGTRPAEPANAKPASITQDDRLAGFAREAFLPREHRARPLDDLPQRTTIWPGVRRTQAK
ncbi:acyltransferase family protein [Tardiphaga sp.]|uniref:acyltransferase family protein n=1 Tax=Tardiphaga sp. TaxID=1926292 RepID=UPI00352A0204